MIILRPLQRGFLIVLTSLLLASCAGMAPRPGAGPSTAEQAQRLAAQGYAEQAAKMYMSLADQARSPERENLQLKAVSAALTPQTSDLAHLYLSKIDEKRLTPAQLIDKRLLEAELELLDHHPLAALNVIPQVSPNQPADTQTRILDTTARAQAMAQQVLAAVQTRIELEKRLPADQLEADRKAIWKLLAGATAQDLLNWTAQTPSGELRGWLELAYISKTAPPQLSALQKQLALWAQENPGHPASPLITGELQAQWKELETYPQRIAVLLPLSGKYQHVSEAVLDGILAAYYRSNPQNSKPAIQIYDTGSDPSNAVTKYRQAIQDGADFVIGPLDRDAVDSLAAMGTLDVPVLSLNYASQGDTSGSPISNLYQFGLMPEDEARQVAERASIEGHDKAVVLVPQTEWGQRLAQAFTQRFEALGGSVLATEYYDPNSADYSRQIRRAFNIDQSRTRYAQLVATIHVAPKFEPRRRQDIDMVFIAGAPRNARLLRPQIKFHHAIGLPVYATSHAYAGVPDPQADRDLNGLEFCDIPWVLPGQNAGLHALHQKLDRLLPRADTQFPRLVALGVDAYDVIPYLKRLAKQNYEHFSGLTGNLHMDPQHRLHRELQWAHFVGGRPKLAGAAQEQPAQDEEDNAPIPTDRSNGQP
ncbi:MAG: penicillin-binding protein activator [Gammaproteobacteria bacterium]